jgi:hypothetical protein
MSIPFEARLIDLVNLLVAKGSNFLLTAILFALLSHGMDARAFGDFGYWWSIALMVGGVLLGGFTTAMVRIVVLHGAYTSLLRPLITAVAAVLLGLLSLGLYALVRPGSSGWLLLTVGVFGLVVQVQTALLTLLRVAEATRANMLASLFVVVLVPLAVYLLLGEERALPTVFLSLSCAFLVGTVAAAAGVREQLRRVLAPLMVARAGEQGNLSNATSFIAINIFSYAVVNVDFTLFRLVGSQEDFSAVAGAKIFFERFALPLLLVIAGAVSMRVLRHKRGPEGEAARLVIRFGPLLFSATAATVLALVGTYWIFTNVIREAMATIPIFWALCVAIGYLLYAVNAVLFDLLVVRKPIAVVVRNVTLFMLAHAMLQAAAISGFGVPGWAVGWLLFNLLVMLLLARGGVELRVMGWGLVRGSVTQKDSR